MKKLYIFLTALLISIVSFAQTDSTNLPKKSDTLRIGNIIIIRHGKNAKGTKEINVNNNNNKKKNSKITTNWGIVDIGFSNYNDQTNYLNTGSYLVNSPGSPAFSKSDFKLKTGKSINVNVWFFMQKVNLIKRNLSLKYGLGLELNNYRYRTDISYREDGVIPYSGGVKTNNAFIFRDSVSYSKNKLAADYLTVPLMLSLSTAHNDSKKNLSVGFGVSAGYLYSQRNKQKSSAYGKERNKGEYDLERFKFSYIAELGLGPVRLYGSYSPRSMYEHSLDIRPYTIGFRFTNL